MAKINETPDFTGFFDFLAKVTTILDKV